jgi:hypothetical protein
LCRRFIFPGYYVFPGGAVDTEDKDPDLWMKYVDMDMDEIFWHFGGDIPFIEKAFMEVR